jgi:hypothetical protein
MPIPSRNSALDGIVDYVPNRILKAQELELSMSLQEQADCGSVLDRSIETAEPRT